MEQICFFVRRKGPFLPCRGRDDHRQVDDKSNEIVAIPKLLDMFSIEGAIVTIDAMGVRSQRLRHAKHDGVAIGGCQRDIAKKIGDKGADYVP